MLSGRLFAALGGVALVTALLGRVRVLPRANLWLRVGRFSFDAFYWQVFVALVCAICAFAYFGAARLTQRSPNQIAGLASFFLLAVASAIWLVSGFVPTSRRPIMPLFAAMFFFLLGLALSVANVASVFLRE